ncbi:hypothetical protein NDU88_008000 [Pleurodeles waltl]|uniref:Uncharacterized protein n=1 Tax=Pleurodeles waltl TaxID=8319 RepID=A0AAV7QM89_PLEWA|nr:hypothetical protein NDU88_008000 [Pleurodeles waltl]
MKRRFGGGGLQAPGSNEWEEEETGIGLFINGPELPQCGTREKDIRRGGIQAPGSNEQAEEETSACLVTSRSCRAGHVNRTFRGGGLQAPGSNERAEEETGISLFNNGLHSCSAGRTNRRFGGRTSSPRQQRGGGGGDRHGPVY